MAIIWGSGGKEIDFGLIESRICEVCEKERPFKLLLQYRYWGFYWIFNRVTEKKYLQTCELCRRGWELDTSKVEDHLIKSGISPIPFMTRYGLLIFIAIVVFGIFLGVLTEGKHK